MTRLFEIIAPHPTYEAAIRMNNRSFRKIGTVARMSGSWPYTQTALLQRVLGFGWRMEDLGINLGELRPALNTMPVSVGVVITRCPAEIVKERNHARKDVPETAHEDRAHMVDLMQPAIELAVEVLNERGVPVLELDTTQPIDAARRQLVDYACREPFDASQGRLGSEMAVLPSPPPWWR